MTEKLMSLLAHPLVIPSITFVAGIFAKEWIIDRFFSFLHKNRRMQQRLDKGTPSVFTVPIRNQIDCDNLQKRIGSCTTLFQGKFVINGEDNVVFELTPSSVPTSITNSLRLLHIENTCDCSCSVLDIGEQQKQKVAIHSSELNYIGSGESIGILFDEYQKPDSIVIDCDGMKICYKLRDKNGSIHGDPLGKSK